MLHYAASIYRLFATAIFLFRYIIAIGLVNGELLFLLLSLFNFLYNKKTTPFGIVFYIHLVGDFYAAFREQLIIMRIQIDFF